MKKLFLGVTLFLICHSPVWAEGPPPTPTAENVKTYHGIA